MLNHFWLHVALFFVNVLFFVQHRHYLFVASFKSVQAIQRTWPEKDGNHFYTKEFFARTNNFQSRPEQWSLAAIAPTSSENKKTNVKDWPLNTARNLVQLHLAFKMYFSMNHTMMERRTAKYHRLRHYSSPEGKKMFSSVLINTCRLTFKFLTFSYILV